MICPIPLSDYPHVLLAHGGGGKLMQDLIGKMFAGVFRSEALDVLHDGAVLESDGKRLAFTTDSFVVHPRLFPGGDIGSLSICGTVNDLAMCGARPRYIAASFILEEGLPMEELWKIVQSMKRTADAAGVSIVTGDTKVVERGKGDGIFITTTGIGVVEHEQRIDPRSVRAGDAILLSGDVGRHGMAIMATREGLEFQTTIQSDAAPLHEPVLALLDAGIEVHCLRDATRGGVATVLNEIAASAKVHCAIREEGVVVRDEVRGACEILGLDPLYVANEGTFVTFVPEAVAGRALSVLRNFPVSSQAAVIGSVRSDSPGIVTLKNRLGTTRVLQMLSGEQLPRIC